MKIEDVISQRLKLQSTQKILENDFGIKDFSKSTIINFITNLKTYTDKERQKFIITIGGPANFKKTKSYLESL